ncbi:21.9 kDa heat shock protein-like [Phragmites australis]|uniref:21.9 kDa heat shock protein-like n=1 Tax=Phragmites australis TaxID=29695 RepID=UPI002D792043|nr:21.9 kDa heat shock protein-like [Phragmites australis]
MAAVRRKALASAAVLAASLVVALLAAPALALVPYGRAGELWDLLLDDPFRALEQSPLAAPRPGGEAGLAGVVLARCDWKETPEAHVISVDVPGVRREDVRVEVEENNRVLRVSGERRAEEDKEGERWHRAERAAGRFWRRFRMPYGADVDLVSARLENGVLTVTVPKVTDNRRREPRVISIAGEDGERGAEVKASKAEM